MGALLFIVLLAFRITLTLKITGRKNLEKHSNHIFCLWHSYVPLALQSSIPSIRLTLDRKPHVWMQHPCWYMKPVHILLRMMHVDELVLGSTAHSGREAAEKLVEHLQQGCSTVLNPDGPHGPAFILKKGVLHMSLQSQVPIIAVQFKASRFLEFDTWDHKKFAYPFSTIEMKMSKPIQITSDNFAQAETLITRALG